LKKILFITFEYPTYTPFGGIAFYYGKVAHFLSKNNFDITVLTAKLDNAGGVLIENSSCDNLREIYICCEDAGDFERRGLDWMLLQSAKYDFLEIPEYGSLFYNAVTKNLFKNIASKLVIRVHGTTILANIYNQSLFWPRFIIFMYNILFLNRMFLRILKILNSQHYPLAKRNFKEYLMVKSADIVTAPSILMAKFINKYWLGGKRTVVYPNPGQYDVIDVERKLFLNNEFKIVYINRLQYLKGFDLYYQLSKAFLKSSNIRFSAYGSYNQLNIGFSVEEIRKTVCLKGFIASNDLIDIYKESDVIIIPSRFESFSNVALEAMSFGCLVIVSDNIGMSEHINHGVNGFIFQSGNFKSLHSIFKDILERDPSELKQISLNAYQTALELSKNIELLKFYKSINSN
jgi:glycosyltransferase involved in cell wall biosynthesis